jgi:hypothetical protein
MTAREPSQAFPTEDKNVGNLSGPIEKTGLIEKVSDEP